MLHKTQAFLFFVLLFNSAVKYTACSEESCYLYRRKGNVTIDTDQCLWESFTESEGKLFCLESCFNNSMVRVNFNVVVRIVQW